jgi:hypothetical protein
MKRVLCQIFAVVACVLATTLSPVWAQDDKASKTEQERRKREEKAVQKELKEERQSRQIADEIQAKVDADVQSRLDGQGLHPDKFLQDYVNELGQSLVPTETPEGVLFSFRALNGGEPEAAAYPDGRVFVTTSLLCFVQNEAQLAVVLGHEIGHVLEKHTIDAIKQARSFKRRVLPGLIGAVGGAVLGGLVKGKEGAAVGAGVGAVAGTVFSVIDFNKYQRQQEDEADVIGTRLALAGGFDASEGVAFFKALAEKFGDKDRLSSFVYASHSRNLDRMTHIRALLDGELSGTYNARRAAGELTLGSSHFKIYTSAMVRDAAIEFWMDEQDRYDIAKGLLEQIAEYRMRDPKTLWGLGRVYKMVGREPADKAKALDYLQRAAQLDERNLYPEIHRDLGLMQARLATSGGTAPAVESLKKYILGYMSRHSDPSPYPPDLEQVYDYLLIFGDSNWLAPRMEGSVVRASAPPPPVAPAAKPGAAARDTAKALAPSPKKKPTP